MTRRIGLGDRVLAHYKIDCETPERAREIAARVLEDHVTTVELRPIHDSALG